MLRSLFTTAGIIAATSVFAASASAQAICGKRTDIVGKLESGYEEQKTAAGLAHNGHLMEVFTSKNGTWTIIFTQPGGPTCLVATGENWLGIEAAAKVTGRAL